MIVIEVLGGVVQAVYSDDPSQKAVLIDWDNVHAGDTVDAIQIAPLEQDSEATKQQILRL